MLAPDSSLASSNPSANTRIRSIRRSTGRDKANASPRESAATPANNKAARANELARTTPAAMKASTIPEAARNAPQNKRWKIVLRKLGRTMTNRKPQRERRVRSIVTNPITTLQPIHYSHSYFWTVKRSSLTCNVIVITTRLLLWGDEENRTN